MKKKNNGDFSPTQKGSKEQKEALSARKEMLGWFAKITTQVEVKRKTWEERMELRAKDFKIKDK